MDALISRSGYSIKLDQITPEQLTKLKKNLTVKPKVISEYSTDKDTSFPVYRISNTRIYLPRYYGINKYSMNYQNTLKDGTTIDFNFAGQLKEHQTDFCNQMLTSLKTDMSCIGCSQTGSGKCMGLNTPIRMYDGTIKKIQNIAINDKLMGDDSTPRTVHSICSGRDIMYEITTEYSEKFTANGAHILCLKSNTTIYEMSIDYYLNECPEELKKSLRLYREPIEYPYTKPPIDPYVYGIMIGIKIKQEIPNIYKINDLNVRRELLKGVKDSNGDTDLNIKVIDDLTEISKSLGKSSNIRFDIKCLGYNYYYGFELDGNGRYLLDNYIVTHNTTMALWLVSQIKKKTLIVVHKQFLLDQWKERIEQFLPNTSIGIIKQNFLEVNNDIVLCMLQTLLSRDYPKGTFDSFGLTIYDEVHHLGAKHFSNVFYKLGTKLNLGLSATPIRSDGLTKVIEWFLGSTITNKIMSEIESPVIKIIDCEYSSEIVPKFNHKGSLNTQNLLNQLVLDPKRNNMIMDEIILQHSIGRKIIVLSGRRGHLYTLNELIKKKSPSIKTGLYLGGMSNEELEKSNKQDVIFGTYNMVAEAYDNPSLDTLIMASGISSVQQSIGRILRRKNKMRPLVIDFTDTEFLGGQAKRRLVYYKKNEYIIESEIEESFNNLDDNCLFD